MKYDISKTESFSAVIEKLCCGSVSKEETKTNKRTMTTSRTIVYKNINNNKIRNRKESMKFTQNNIRA